jgi:uncharacterized protein (DUF433 family)
MTTATTNRITKTPGVCGGDACIEGHRIQVWLLVEARRLGLTDVRLRESYPSLLPSDLEAAWKYHRLNALEIERNIWENQAVMEEQDGDYRLALIIRGWQLGIPDAEIRDAFSPPLSEAELAVARQEYRRRKAALDKALPDLLPEELREGLNANGLALR